MKQTNVQNLKRDCQKFAEEYQRRLHDKPCFWMKRLDFIEMSNLPKLLPIFQPKLISVRIPKEFFLEIEKKIILKLIWT